MVAMLALAAIAVEVARLTDTATEVQVSADVGAMGAAVARARGKTETDAIEAGKDVASLNFADGRPVDRTGVDIVAGHYDPTAAPGSMFDPAGTPHNAFRSIVTVGGVRFLTASILNGQTGTDVQKRAVAAADCPSDEVANFPMAVCTRFLTEIQPGDTCTDRPQLASLVPDGGQVGCWTNLGGGGSANINTYRPLLPQVCNGGGGRDLSAGDSIDLQNGQVTSFLQLVQCCVACQDQHKFIVPVIDCNVSSCNQSTPTVGFATINIATYQDIVLGGGGQNNCLQYFPACSYPAGGNIDNPSYFKKCVPGCSNAGTVCQNNAGCSGCTGGCQNQEGLRINQTCSNDTGGSGGGRCFGSYTVVLGQP